ncbi:hypothetical protein G6F22_014910 [Rhizopus arrhizus]|nr:hypothetical protein G6F22_014910 [Rhizopus arrhizus]
MANDLALQAGRAQASGRFLPALLRDPWFGLLLALVALGVVWAATGTTPAARAGDGAGHPGRAGGGCAVPVAVAPATAPDAGLRAAVSQRANPGAGVFHDLCVPVRGEPGGVVSAVSRLDQSRDRFGVACQRQRGRDLPWRDPVDSQRAMGGRAVAGVQAHADLPDDRVAAVRAADAAVLDEPDGQHHHEHLAGLAGGRARPGRHRHCRQQHRRPQRLHHPGLFHAIGAFLRLLLSHRALDAVSGTTP